MRDLAVDVLQDFAAASTRRGLGGSSWRVDYGELPGTAMRGAAAQDRRELDDVLRLVLEARRAEIHRWAPVEIDGERKTLAAWSREHGIQLGTVHARIHQRGWDVRRALETPLEAPGPGGVLVELDGERDTLHGWTRRIGVVSDRTVRDRLARGWPLREALTTPGKAPRERAAKLSGKQREEIRRRYAAGGVSQRALAREYGVTQGCIGQIVRRPS